MGETKKQRSPLTTLCYIEKDDSYLMLHRIKKKQDVNEGKWIGVGGHFEENESPENCLLREVKEETGLTLTSWRFRGIVTFIAKGWPTEYMCLYTADGFEGTLRECDEGELAWVAKKDVSALRRVRLMNNHAMFLLHMCHVHFPDPSGVRRLSAALRVKSGLGKFHLKSVLCRTAGGDDGIKFFYIRCLII